MFPLLNKQDANPIDFFKFGLILSPKIKRVSPKFSMLWKDDIPKVTEYDRNKLKAEIHLIAGTYKTKKCSKPSSRFMGK